MSALSVSPNADAPANGLIATLMALLDAAETHIENDLEATRRSLARANALLRGEAASPAARGLQSGGLAPWQMRQAIAYIDANLEDRIQIEDLAPLARLSPRYFASAFKRSFGMPPHAYLMQRRVERAQTLMVSTDMGLSEIALACGLTDQPHLNRLFSRAVGVPPAQWRRQRRSLN